MESSKRVYRSIQPADLPNVSSGKDRAFYESAGLYFPATLVGTKFRGIPDNDKESVGWCVKFSSYEMISYGNANIVVDVTPEKRYGIWSHKMGRFALLASYGPFAANVFLTRESAEAFLVKSWPDVDQRRNFYVVEWEIRSND